MYTYDLFKFIVQHADATSNEEHLYNIYNSRKFEKT